MPQSCQKSQLPSAAWFFSAAFQEAVTQLLTLQLHANASYKRAQGLETETGKLDYGANFRQMALKTWGRLHSPGAKWLWPSKGTVALQIKGPQGKQTRFIQMECLHQERSPAGPPSGWHTPLSCSCSSERGLRIPKLWDPNLQPAVQGDLYSMCVPPANRGSKLTKFPGVSPP